jgi:CelD/BcsL family acetyltransferase involved in cellulose biosynthesis
VSLPFSDHCDPLVDRPDDLSAMLEFLRGEVEGGRYRSFELRPLSGVGRPFPVLSERHEPTRVEGRVAAGTSYYLHTLDLTQSAEQIFDGLHPSCARRAIRRAEREGLSYEAGTSDRLVSSFYELLRLTRRRHGLPPQPLTWFRNLIACVRDGLAIHVASKDGLPVAGILTLSFKKTMVYKYGGSDARHHRLGSMPFLFWRAIQWAKAQGIEEMDLGRSALDQSGLIAFKDHFGATRTTLTYYTCPERRPGKAHAGPLSRAARRVVAHLPDAALDLTGRLLYKHLG